MRWTAGDRVGRWTLESLLSAESDDTARWEAVEATGGGGTIRVEVELAPRPDLGERARLTRSVRHTNIWPIRSVGTVGEHVLVVRDHLDGLLLGELFTRERLPTRALIQVVSGVASALEAGIDFEDSAAHGGLGEATIGVTRSGKVWVKGFGRRGAQDNWDDHIALGNIARRLLGPDGFAAADARAPGLRAALTTLSTSTPGAVRGFGSLLGRLNALLAHLPTGGGLAEFLAKTQPVATNDWGGIPEPPSSGTLDWTGIPEPPKSSTLDWSGIPEPPNSGTLDWSGIPEPPSSGTLDWTGIPEPPSSGTLDWTGIPDPPEK